MRKTILFSVLIFFVLNLNSFELKKIFRIGSDEKNYDFFLIGDIKQDSKEYIYVLDIKGYFLRKYTKDGEFVKEVGRRGLGPGEFDSPTDIILTENRVKVLNLRSRRLIIFDKDLNLIREERVYNTMTDFIELKDKIITFGLNTKSDGLIRILDKKYNIKKEFLKKYPPMVESIKKDKFFRFVRARITEGLLAINKRDEIVYATRYYYNDYKIYILDMEGRIKKEITINVFKDYKYPKFLLRLMRNIPNKYEIAYLDYINFVENYTLFLHFRYGRINKVKNIDINTDIFLIIDVKSGKIIERKENKSKYRVLSNYGKIFYIKCFDEDLENFYKFEMELKR